MPTITIEQDYDGYFETLVRKWCEKKLSNGQTLKHAAIVVDSGPYRSSALSYRSEGDTLYLDFYSAIRVGFGKLGPIEPILAIL